MDDNGTYLGNIYGIYKECITNISIDIYDIKYQIITHTQTQWGGRRRRRLCVWIFYIINIYGYISYTFPIYSIYIFSKYDPCIFHCVFLNLWSQEKTSPYRKTTFISFYRFYTFYIFINNFIIFIKINIFKQNRAHMGPWGPYGPIWAPTRTGPQPGLGPNPGPANSVRPM